MRNELMRLNGTNIDFHTVKESTAALIQLLGQSHMEHMN